MVLFSFISVSGFILGQTSFNTRFIIPIFLILYLLL
jgi:hypothetical protein